MIGSALLELRSRVLDPRRPDFSELYITCLGNELVAWPPGSAKDGSQPCPIVS